MLTQCLLNYILKTTLKDPLNKSDIPIHLYNCDIFFNVWAYHSEKDFTNCAMEEIRYWRVQCSAIVGKNKKIYEVRLHRTISDIFHRGNS